MLVPYLWNVTDAAEGQPRVCSEDMAHACHASTQECVTLAHTANNLKTTSNGDMGPELEGSVLVPWWGELDDCWVAQQLLFCVSKLLHILCCSFICISSETKWVWSSAPTLDVRTVDKQEDLAEQ